MKWPSVRGMLGLTTDLFLGDDDLAFFRLIDFSFVATGRSTP
jgi:hypothetical protein